MRDLIIIIVIIAAILSGDLYINKYLGDTSAKLIQNLKDLKENVLVAEQTENREEVKKEMEQMDKSWKETSEIWAIIVMHQEIDNIEQALIKTKAMINNGNIEDAIPEIETAIFFIEHVNAREKLDIKNIF